MRAAWVTDIHLDFLSHAECEEFFASIVWESPDVVFVTGDTSIAPSLLTHLEGMNRALSKPIYFVLGNHDFYRGRSQTCARLFENTCTDIPC